MKNVATLCHVYILQYTTVHVYIYMYVCDHFHACMESSIMSIMSGQYDSQHQFKKLTSNQRRGVMQLSSRKTEIMLW